MILGDESFRWVIVEVVAFVEILPLHGELSMRRLILSALHFAIFGLLPQLSQAQTATLTIASSTAQFWVQDPVISVAFDLVAYPFDDRSITGSLACHGNGVCSSSFPIGSTVTLNFSAPGAAAKGIGFIGWEGTPQTCIGLGPCSFVISQDTALAYGFILPPFPPNVVGVSIPVLSNFAPSSVSTNTDVTFTASITGLAGGHLIIPGLTTPFESTFDATSDTSGVYTLQISGDRLAQFTKPVLLAVFADACDDSCYTHVFSLSITPTNCSSGLQPGASASLFDPVPTLLDPGSPSITTDPTDLIDPSKGRPVIGVAADGVAQLVVRIPACKLGENVTVTILNDSNSSSSSTDDDGGVSIPGNTTLTSYGQTVVTTAIGTSDQPIGIITYRAPIDFPRDDHSTDADALARYVTLQIRLDSLPEQPIIKQIKIIRPLTLFVHGIWGSEADWDNFTPFLENASPTLTIAFADYDDPIDVESADPITDRQLLDSVTGSSLGINFNARVMVHRMVNSVVEFAHSNNVSSIKADVVAHSMGGLIIRTLPSFGASFLSHDTYGQGSVHKLITLDTPYLGTPLAQELLQRENRCVRNFLAGRNVFAFNQVVIRGSVVSGGVGDLVGDGFGGGVSPALAALSTLLPIPTALVAGTMNQQNFDGLQNCVLCAAFVLPSLFGCPFDPLAASLTPERWTGLFSQDSDGIVPLLSQLNHSLIGQIIPGVIHSPGTTQLGFNGPSILDAPNRESSGPAIVIRLLNEPITGPDYKKIAQ